MESAEIHTPRTLTFFSGHLKLGSGRIFSFFPVIDPIHKASGFFVIKFEAGDNAKTVDRSESSGQRFASAVQNQSSVISILA